MADDGHLEEKEALALAKEEGIEFVDTFQIEGEEKTYESRKAAEKAAEKLDGKPNIIQIRSRK